MLPNTNLTARGNHTDSHSSLAVFVDGAVKSGPQEAYSTGNAGAKGKIL